MLEQLAVTRSGSIRAGITLAALAVLACGTGTTAHAEYLLADGDPEAGEALSTTCAACHGSDGNSSNPEWPSLAGQHAMYLVRQLRAFREGDRQNAMMSGQAQRLSNEDMRHLAAYYARLALEPRTAADGELGLGERLYRGGNAERNVPACIACHGPRGQGNPLAHYPRIAGQHARYLRNTLEAYKSGERRSDGDLGEVMRDIAGRLTDEEIDAVAAYLQGLR